jgi:NAD(P)-dependent dehydrogenase (short-subunit alcohol dehydrogenase family)
MVGSMTADLPLEGRVAWVAGAAGPFGRVIAVALAEAGADLALSVGARDEAAVFAMNSIANELWALDRRQLALTVDSADPQSSAAALEQIVRELGRLDLLVTLPGPAPERLPVAEIDPSALAAIVQERLTGVLLLCRAAGAAMLERGGGILNVTLAPGPDAGAAPAAAEAGVLGLTRPLAREWAGRVAVNAVRLRDQTDPAAVAALALRLAATLPPANGGAVTGQIFELSSPVY